MNLHFERRNGYFISEFEVTNDFNLHIEKDPIGQFLVYQRTAGGAYDLVADFGKNKGDDPIIDYDFSALVYPKYIQIKSSVNPAIATITTDGEVNELVYQEKSINITSNGAVAISADSGYNGLALVNVKVDVPTEGGGSGIEADDVLWYNNVYIGYPSINFSKGTYKGPDENGEFVETSIPLDILSDICSTFEYHGLYGEGTGDFIISNLRDVNYVFSTEDMFIGAMFSGIRIEGVISNNDYKEEPFTGILCRGIKEWSNCCLVYLPEEGQYLHQKYPRDEHWVRLITKFIASNGNEVIVPEREVG